MFLFDFEQTSRNQHLESVSYIKKKERAQGKNEEKSIKN